MHVKASRCKKFRVFWDVAPCSHVKLTDVSEVLIASIIRATIEPSP
jgi:hypothetical protein